MRFMLAERDMTLAVVLDPADATAALAGPVDLLIVGACWFAMDDERYSSAQRNEYAYVLTSALRSRLIELRNQRCPVLAMHTAVICFDGDPAWADWLGGTWNWRSSWHPEPGLLDVQPVPNERFTIEPFSVVDELYQNLDIADDVEPIAESASGDLLAWIRATDDSIAAVDLLGHDHRSLDHPVHRRLLHHLLDQLTG